MKVSIGKKVSANGKSTESKEVARINSVSQILVGLQRNREATIKSRIKIWNRLLGLTTTADFGYNSNVTSVEDRQKIFGETAKHIEAVMAGKKESKIKKLIEVHCQSIESLTDYEDTLSVEMEDLAKSLHVANWVRHQNQKGFGWQYLASVVGECGSLFNYSAPSKVWRMLGCHPWEFEGITAMGEAWRKKWTGMKLPDEEWVEFKYNPKRRKLSYLIGQGLMKQNGSGPYRQRYEYARVQAEKNHPDWKPMHLMKHGMLLAGKLLLKKLWIQWYLDARLEPPEDKYGWSNR